MSKPLLPPLFFSVRLPTWLAIFWRVHLSRQRIVGVSQKESLSFLVVRLDSLGDLVLTTPLFRALKRAHPQSRCTVVVQPPYKPLLVTNPHVDEILILPRIGPEWLPLRLRRFLSACVFYWTHLRNRHFDFAISPRWDVDEHLATLLCALTDAARRVGYTSEASPAKQVINRGFDAIFDICLPPGPVQHEALRDLAIAEAAGATSQDDQPEIHITERDRREAAKLLAKVPAGKKLVVLGIGAHSPGRRWLLERYAETITKLSKEKNVQAVIVCSSAERSQAEKLDRLLGHSAIVVGGARLREVCAVLERCDLLIGNDSGCAHLAAAMGCKTLVISRHPRDGDPNHCNSPLRFAPKGSQVRVLQPPSGMNGCKSACAVAGPHCITRVSVDEAVAAACRMLNVESAPLHYPKELIPQRSQRLLDTHSADAVRRAVETLRSQGRRPSP